MGKCLFHDGKIIINILHDHNHQAYFVGGSVRDDLLHRPVHDIDLVTSATPEEIMDIFPKVIPVGIDHGTVIVRYNKNSYELTTFRFQERKLDKIGVDYKIDPLLYNDLKHRDFTINAIAMDINKNIIDPFGGRRDIKQRSIRGVDDPIERLQEDPLRILRAYRFVSELGFLIDDSLKRAIKQINPQLENIAPERISQEFTKLVNGQYVQQALKALVNLETYRYLPVIQQYYSEFIQLPKQIKPLKDLSEFFALMNFLNPNLRIHQLAKTWKSSREIARQAHHLLNMLKHYQKKRLNAWLVYRLGKTYIDSFVRLVNILFPKDRLTKQQLKLIYLKLPITTREELDISGKDLKLMFPQRKPGQWIQKMLETIEKIIVNKMIPNEKESIKEWVKCHPPEDV